MLAAIEVRSYVRPHDVSSILANMASIKTLDKSAYFEPKGILRTETYVHGRTYLVFPTLYFLFAFDSADLTDLSAEFNKQLSSTPVDKRLDCACILAKGMLVNRNSNGTIDAAPGPGTILSSYPTGNALLLFYLLITAYLLQAPGTSRKFDALYSRRLGILICRACLELIAASLSRPKPSPR